MTTHRYSIPSQQHEGWAILFLDDAGCFAALSDYGTWGHRWPARGFAKGEDIRQFLLTCDDGYLLGKLAMGRRHEYQSEATLRAVKEWIIRERRDGYFGREKAKREWDLLEDCDNLADPGSFGSWLEQTAAGDAFEFARYDYPADARMFIAKAWPRLKAAIRAELGAEAASARAAFTPDACHVCVEPETEDRTLHVCDDCDKWVCAGCSENVGAGGVRCDRCDDAREP